MKYPKLAELPPPSPGKTGWPWTVETPPLLPDRPDGCPWPRISIVTPSYNQGQFIEETIRSVLLQGYPDLEYIIIDGGSTDNSVEIIAKYEFRLAYWVSEKDRGQSHAINRGFCRSTGCLLGWLNSDDVLLPNALVTVAMAVEIPYEKVLIAGTAEYRDVSGTGVIWVHNRIPQTCADVFSRFDTYFALGTFAGGREKAPAAICRKVAEAKATNSKQIEIWGDGQQTRSFMYIEDCIGGLLSLMASDFHDPINIGSAELVSINRLVDLVEEIANIRLAACRT
jgi:glycosyltransferase involved in cell wall biosynthesis